MEGRLHDLHFFLAVSFNVQTALDNLVRGSVVARWSVISMISTFFLAVSFSLETVLDSIVRGSAVRLGTASG